MYGYSFRVGVVLLSVVMAKPIHGQSNAARFIRGLDTNGNGDIEPNEITRQSRRHLEKIARYRRLDLSEPNSIRRWDDAIRRYNERRRSGDRRVAPKRYSGVVDFRPNRESPLVPGFGLPQIKFPYTQEDLDEADDTLRRADRNDDGFVDRSEARRSPWTRTDPFESDSNKDNRLSRLELAQRYASRRLLEDGRDRRFSSTRRTAEYDDDRSGRSRDQSRSSGEPSDKYTRYLTESLMRRYDTNRNRDLELRELGGVGINLGEADLNQNDVLTREELEQWLSRELEARVNDLSDILPSWFFDRDTDGDGQIQMAEFATKWDAEKIGQFERLDLNHDGLITSNELLRSSAVVGGTFSNSQAEVLAPHTTTVSEIEVAEDYIIGDLDLQLSITHTYAGQLDGYLIGPDGQRIELFTGVGRDGDHFDKTVFDDEARSPITKARSPFRGAFRPEAKEKKDQPSLSRYKNKNLKGLWQLMVRANRSDRPGMLHGWSLLVKPIENSNEMLD